MKIALQFTQDLKNASLDNGKLDPDTLYRLRNPAQEPLAIEDEDVLFAIKLFFSTSDASQEVYTKSRKAVLERHPDDPYPFIPSNQEEGGETQWGDYIGG